ncbi:MAG: acyl-CoA dehydratase activase [Fusobacteriota bacterium]
MRFLGIDLGSREVKIAVMQNDKIIFKKKISTMGFYKNYCSFDGKVKVDLHKIGIKNIDKAVSTGYGRNNTDLKKFEAINEVKAHAYGGILQSGLKDFILLDIGGQDVKIVKIEKELITDLQLNDKCAASCGRYLENMATVLEIPLMELSKYRENPVDLNSTCAVFSESELIGKIAEGKSIEELAAGVNYSLYKRLKPLINKFRGKNLVVTGGVAKNKSIIDYLSRDYDNVILVDHPQYNGAIGACYYGKKTFYN